MVSASIRLFFQTLVELDTTKALLTVDFFSVTIEAQNLYITEEIGITTKTLSLMLSVLIALLPQEWEF